MSVRFRPPAPIKTGSCEKCFLRMFESERKILTHFNTLDALRIPNPGVAHSIRAVGTNK